MSEQTAVRGGKPLSGARQNFTVLRGVGTLPFGAAVRSDTQIPSQVPLTDAPAGAIPTPLPGFRQNAYNAGTAVKTTTLTGRGRKWFSGACVSERPPVLGSLCLSELQRAEETAFCRAR